MFKRTVAIVTALALTVLLGMSISATTDDLRRPGDLTVHEWGTFTTVAGPNGQAIDWLPLSGPTDLPCFVNHFEVDSRLQPKIINSLTAPLSYTAARTQLTGSVRMETPVLYFYGSQQQDVQVRVDFPQGIVTEWYPPAKVTPSVVRRNALTSSVNTDASITWNNVRVLPFANVNFPKGASGSHYYAARETDAAPIQVDGKYEKFLFYRGVGGFPVPINATVTNEGKIMVKYLANKPELILFENRGGKIGYRVLHATKSINALLDPPALTGDFESLREELEAVLVGQGLYAKEAKAMVDTWRDSWFEEGTRLFYIVPSKMVDTILPLKMDPKPAHVARVFVGRVELITPATIKAVENAIAADDTKALQVYGRFLGPIAERIAAKNPRVSDRIPGLLESAFKSYVADLANCSN